MPQIKIGRYLFALLGCTAMGVLSGCGDSTSTAKLNGETGKHVSDWIARHPATARSSMDSCAKCHGEDLNGGISLVSCMSPTAIQGFTCHATSPAGNPAGCLSCHGGPPTGPYGTTAPNRKFAHGKHTALTGCDSCHLGAGSGSTGHAKATASGVLSPAMVTMSSAFKAKTLTTFGFSATTGTCSGVSCHGGQQTPSWSSGVISMSTDCALCHEQGTAPGVPQYNSYYSGFKGGQNLHALHLQSDVLTILCTDCHNIGTLTDYLQHFSGIGTKTFTNPPNTVGNKGSASPTKIVTYFGPTQKCSTIACHPDTTWSQP